MEICGPITTQKLADRFAFTVGQTFAALEALEGEGIVLRGRFELNNAPPEAAGFDDSGDKTSQEQTEWCHRRLLARVHRLTMQGLRKQIQPVDVATFQRFLTRHHGVLAGHQKQDANGVFEAVAQLQGLECSAIAWEQDILQARVVGYDRRWLDDLCLSGEVGWGRLFPARQPTRTDDDTANADADCAATKKPTGVSKVVPVTFFLRSDRAWLSMTRPTTSEDGLSEASRRVLTTLGCAWGSICSRHCRRVRDLNKRRQHRAG